MASNRDVQIGDRTVTIQAFKGFKALEVARIVAAIGKQAPDVQQEIAEFTNQYEESNTVKITPGMAVLPRYEGLGLTDDHFARSGGVIEVPLSPKTWEQVAAVFPSVFEAARDDVVKLLALLTTPNSELREWDEADAVDDELEKEGRKLLHDADFDQYVDLLIAAVEVVQEQFKGKADAVGKVAGLWSGRQSTKPNSTRSRKKPGSSTDSPAHTDGTGERSSSESGGERSSLSASG